jgi:ABC-2 type transport system permease protein
MRKTLVIAVREYLAAVRTKSFVISLLVLPLMMGGGLLVRVLLKDQVDIQEKRFAVVDRTPGGKYVTALETAARRRNQENIYDPQTGKQTQPVFAIERVPLSGPEPGDIDQQRYDLSERVRKQELFGFLEIDLLPPHPAAGADPPKSTEPGRQVPPQGWVIAYYYSNSPTYQESQRWAEDVINQTAREQRFHAVSAQLSGANLQALLQRVPLEIKGLIQRNTATGQIEGPRTEDPTASLLVPGGLMFVLFMLIMVGATPLMHSVVEEKMQRIAEVLLGSVRPFELMMGKLLGMVGVSFTLTAVYLGCGYAAAYRYGYAHFLAPEVLAWFILYQALAVLMFGSLFVAIGAACTDIRETQTMIWPVMLLIMLPIFIWLNVIREPNSAFVQGVSFFPFATPVVMLGRLAVPPGIPWWQPVLGALLVLATTVLCVYAAGRIFRVGILMQGKGAQLGEMMKWVFRG